jgi:hypothetical protein
MLWLRIDEDLIGGTDDAGCYHRPEALAAALPEWEGPIRVWLAHVAGYGPETSRESVFRLARHLLRQLGAGRAEAHAEYLEELDEGRTKIRGRGKTTVESKLNRGKAKK